MKNCFLLLVSLVVIASCKQSPKENIQAQQLANLFGMMQGSFNSEAQAKADSSYYNIALHMYPIWEDKGNWLYVEQALNTMQDKPYRQRIYEVKILNDTSFTSRIYTIPNDSLWVGKWKTPEAFSSLTPEDLTLRTGCHVILFKTSEDTFEGKTGDKTCESTLRGAAYARSEVKISPAKIMSWDRGFDTEGNHVWGAEKAGYVFEKLIN